LLKSIQHHQHKAIRRKLKQAILQDIGQQANATTDGFEQLFFRAVHQIKFNLGAWQKARGDISDLLPQHQFQAEMDIFGQLRDFRWHSAGLMQGGGTRRARPRANPS